jgi:GMP synthase-like glutamine amidotransferase
MRPVVGIRNDASDTLGITAGALAEARIPLLRLDAFEHGVRWPELDEIGGLIVFGGEMNVDEVDRHPQLLAERHLMRRAVDAGLPVLGICLGAQMLARAFDAGVHPAPVRELGFKTIRITDAGAKDALLSAFHSGDRVFQWHEDTFDLPVGAELLASGDDVPNQAFRLGRNAWGVQFHFEIELEGVEAWLRVSEPTLTRDWKKTADEVRRELRLYLDAQQERSRALLAAFAQHVGSFGLHGQVAE